MADIEAHARSMLLKARDQAEALLTEAQAQALLIKDGARKEGLAEGLATGRTQGLDEGRQTGHDAALAQYSEQFKQLMNALALAATELDASRRRLEVDAIGDVVKLSIEIARRVIKKQAAIDPGVLAANLNEAMKLVVHASDVRIAVHPSEKTTLSEEIPRLKLNWPNLEHVELIEDEGVSPGGCRLSTVDGHIDGELERQLDRIVSDLMPGKDRASDS